MKTGIAVALAWPETYCKQAGGWYDGLLHSLGFNKGHYYQAGHAALLLIKKWEEEIHYFDFGRYHAPKGFGRVRSKKTDPELALPVKAAWSKTGELTNLPEILNALNSNPAYHGDGVLHASLSNVDFALAMAKALEIQNLSPVKYGPFTYGGSNCSRFVNTVLLHANPGLLKWVRLYFPWTLTPSPMSNVRSFGQIHKNGEKNTKGIPVCLNPKITLPQPERPSAIPPHAKWLSGEGAGSWFTVDEYFGRFLIHRFSSSGHLEFGGVYQLVDEEAKLDIEQSFEVVHLSHFQKVRILQNGNVIKLQLEAIRNLDFISELKILPRGGFQKTEVVL